MLNAQPLETLDAIASLLPPQSLLSMSLTSKRCVQVCQRHIFREVRFRDVRRIFREVEPPQAAREHVRFLHVEYFPILVQPLAVWLAHFVALTQVEVQLVPVPPHVFTPYAVLDGVDCPGSIPRLSPSVTRFSLLVEHQAGPVSLRRYDLFWRSTSLSQLHIGTAEYNGVLDADTTLDLPFLTHLHFPMDLFAQVKFLPSPNLLVLSLHGRDYSGKTATGALARLQLWERLELLEITCPTIGAETVLALPSRTPNLLHLNLFVEFPVTNRDELNYSAATTASQLEIMWSHLYLGRDFVHHALLPCLSLWSRLLTLHLGCITRGILRRVEVVDSSVLRLVIAQCPTLNTVALGGRCVSPALGRRGRYSSRPELHYTRCVNVLCSFDHWVLVSAATLGPATDCSPSTFHCRCGARETAPSRFRKP